MSDNQRKLAGDAAGNPDVTIKVTDDQLNKSAAMAKNVVQSLRAQVNAGTDEDEDALGDTRTNITSGSITSFFRFFQKSLLPDLPDRDQTEVISLLDATRGDLDAQQPPDNAEIHTDLDKTDRMPKLQDFCTLRERFAEGGQGVLSRAKDNMLRRTIAIKSLRKEILDKPDLRKAFVTEAMITAQLEHPAIVPIHGLFSDDANGLHQAMKLVKGHTLKDELSKFIDLCRGKFPEKKYRVTQGVMDRMVRDRIDLLLKVCEAVAYAHSKNIIHCDLKPENIMIGDYGEVYVMDWGLARRFRDENGKLIQPPKGAPLDGTPRYMPAETFAGQPRDERSDLFALGLILFEMVTLRHGFSGKNIQEVIQRIRTGQRNPVVNRFGFSINRDLEAIIEKATAYDAEDRYQHVAELVTDLRNYLDGMAVSARPENPIEKFFRAIKRHSRTLVVITLLSWGFLAAFITHHLRVLNQQANQDLRDERATTELQRANIRQLEIEHHLAAMDSKVIRSAIRLSNTLVELASHLGHVSESAGLLLSNPANATPTPAAVAIGLPFLPYHEITPQTAVFSPVYNDYIKPDACSYQVPFGRDIERVQNELACLAPITIELRDLLINSLEDLRGAALATQTAALVQEGLLIRRAYIGLHDTSLHIAYPGSGSYPVDYDNHTRTWYYTAKNQADTLGMVQRPIWGKPYLDTSNKQRVLTCSVPIFSPDQKFLGVAAFDLFFETFSEQLRRSGNGAGDEILEKFLCTSDGTILCHVPIHPLVPGITEAETEAALREKLSFLFTRNQERMTGGYGHFKAMEHGKWIHFHFAYIPGLRLYLIEKSSEEKLFRQLDNIDPEELQQETVEPPEMPPIPTDEAEEHAGETAPDHEAQ